MRYADIVHELEDAIQFIDDSVNFQLMDEHKVNESVDSIFAARENIVRVLEALNIVEIDAILKKGNLEIER